MNPNPLGFPNNPNGDGWSPGPLPGGGWGQRATNRFRSAAHLREMMHILWGGKWIILASLALVMTGTYFYIGTLIPEFESSAAVFIDRGPTQAVEGLPFGTSSQASGLGGRSLANEVWIIQRSNELHEEVATRLVDRDTLYLADEFLPILHDVNGNRLPVQQIASRLRSQVRIYPEAGGIDAIRILGISTDPKEAALIANEYAEAYVDRTKETSRSSIRASREFLEDQEQRLLGELNMHENQIQTYKTERGAQALDAEASRTVTQIADLEATRDATRIELEMKRASLNAMKNELAAIEPKLVQSVASPTFRDLQNVQRQISSVEAQIEQIYVRNPEFRDNPPTTGEFPQLEARLTTLREREQELSESYVREALSYGGINITNSEAGLQQVAQRRQQMAEEEIAITGMEAKLQTLNQRLESYQGRLRSIPSQSMRLAQLERSRQSAEQLYVFLTQRLQEVRIAEESELGYAEIVQSAGVPGRPVRPNTGQMMNMALLLGLVMGIGIIILRKQLDTRIRRPDVIREQGLTILGVVPKLDDFIKDKFEGEEYVSVQGHRVSTKLVMLLYPGSPIAEPWRQLRTNIQFSRPDVAIQTLVVTSPNPGEGKSTVVANLALAMASANIATVIIDADLRRPRIHKMFDADREPGLTDLVFEHAPFNPDHFATRIDNLYVIPAGSKVPNPAEVLGSEKMRSLLDRLREAYDVVIIDTPPVLPFSEAIHFAAHCDGTVLVANAGHTEIGAFEHATEKVKSVGAVLIGAVLNQFVAKPGVDYGYKYSYYYKSGYYKYGYYDRYYSDSETDSKEGKGALAKLFRREKTTES